MNTRTVTQPHRRWLATPLALLLAASMASACSSSGGPSGEGETFLAEGEVFLAAATDPGPDPFSTDPLPVEPDPKLATPVTEPSATVESTGSAQITSDSGNKPGLYGGTQKLGVCDSKLLVKFLGENNDKAAAWVAALNADDDVRLPNGDELTTATIPDYVASLTSVVLTQDTRTTNHLFKNGKAVPFQAVLQKGTAVLVDNKGVPRARCFCGNPLLKPVATKVKPKYTGKKWQDFDPGKIKVVQTSTDVIPVFVLQDLKTGKFINRPAGSSGQLDRTAKDAKAAQAASAGGQDPQFTFTASVIGGWKSKERFTKKDWIGSSQLVVAPNPDAYLADVDGLAIGFSIIDATAANPPIDDLLKSARSFASANPRCKPVETDFSYAGFSGKRLSVGPCAKSAEFSASKWRTTEFGLKRADGTTVYLRSLDPDGGSAAESYALATLGTVQTK